MKLKRFHQMNEELDITENDRVGGISNEEYDEIIDSIDVLKEKSKNNTITDEERILSEVLHMIITKEKDNLDYNTYYHRRLGFISHNKRNKKNPEETLNFHKLVWWLQSKYEWNNVETEGSSRVKFDWDSGKTSFWLNDDGTTEGPVPDEIKPDLKSKGIKYSNS